jgi:hypothetical protein
MGKQKYRILICYKNFSKECDVSHIGLGVTAQYTAKTLTHQGYAAQAMPIFGADDLARILRAPTDFPVTHVVICALWIPTRFLAQLAREFPFVHFALNCHSNVGFLQAEPPAIRLVREAIDLETGTTNFYASSNNIRLTSILKDMYGRPVQFLPNLYHLHGCEPIHRPQWQGGTLRIGCFGSHRIYKNFSTAITAAIELSFQLRAQTEIWVNAGRHDGAGKTVYQMARAWTDNVPNVTLCEFPWATWPEFKRMVGTMNLLMQPSYTETFNNVTADGVVEGVPSVVSDAIDWCPRSWRASNDDPKDVASAGRRLLYDPHSAREGYEALRVYVASGIEYWREFLQRP